MTESNEIPGKVRRHQNKDVAVTEPESAMMILRLARNAAGLKDGESLIDWCHYARKAIHGLVAGRVQDIPSSTTNHDA